MTLLAGRSVIVRYPSDDVPDLWQERVLLAKDSEGDWVTLTPDEEFEKVQLRRMEYRVLGPKRSLPTGVKEMERCLVFTERPSSRIGSRRHGSCWRSRAPFP